MWRGAAPRGRRAQPVLRTVVAVRPVDGRESLPVIVREVAQVRPDSDADTAALMWFAAAVLLMMVVRSWPLRALGLVALLAYTGLLELLQRLTPNRSAEWIDMLGNAIGIAAAAVAVALYERRAGRLRPSVSRSQRRGDVEGVT